CVVFSSFNHALADTLDPGLIGHQIGCGTLEADVERMEEAAREPQAWRAEPTVLAALLASCGEEVLLARWERALAAIGLHWQRLQAGERPLASLAPWRLRLDQRLGRLRRWLRR
ncbi:MAG: glycosyltransferase family 1 protein, partial [Synechococcus sp. ELA057]